MFESFDTYLVDNILKQKLLVFVGELLRSYDLRLDNQDENRVLGRTGTVHPVTARIKLSPHGLDVLPELRDRVRVVLEKVDAGTGSGG